MVNNDTDRMYRDFWESLEECLEDRPETPLYVDRDQDLTENYHHQKRNLPAGTNYSLVLNTRDDLLQVKFHIHDHYPDRDDLWVFLDTRRATIEDKLGALEWNREGSYHQILSQRDGDVTDRDQWGEYQDWLIRWGEAFDHVFGVSVAEFER